jgi:glycosyltransferase involved in cell wall biosynthesis
VDPEDAGELAAAMARILSESALARELRAAGPRQAANFSWRRTASETASAYRAVLGLPDGGGAA